MTDNGTPSKPNGFWTKLARKVPGVVTASPNPAGLTQRSRQTSFHAFDDEVSDAWNEGEDDAAFLHRAKPTFAPTTNVSLPAVGTSHQLSPGAVPPGWVSAPVPVVLPYVSENGESPFTPPSSPTQSPPVTPLAPTQHPPLPPILHVTGAAGAADKPKGKDKAGGALGALAMSTMYAVAPTADPTAAPTAAPPVPSAHGTPTPPSPFPTAQSMLTARLDKFEALLHSAQLDTDALRVLSWSGIPARARARTWQVCAAAVVARFRANPRILRRKLLSGYLSANAERRDATLQRKRQEYLGFVDQYFASRHDGPNQATFHQIHIDVPRTSPSVSTFQQPTVQAMLERILYVWAIRHPGSGYVQGMNDLATPFFVVFLADHLAPDALLENCEVESLPDTTRNWIEADTFWCLTTMLDGIHDNYTFAQPGIQRKVRALGELISRIDGDLHKHLAANNVEYLQFSFRWMNCLLLRELPLHCTIRLWDTYHAEVDGFASFHLYVCAAFLKSFSPRLLQLNELQNLLPFLQDVPTQKWTEQDVKIILAEAHVLKSMFHGAQSHLNPATSNT